MRYPHAIIISISNGGLRAVQRHFVCPARGVERRQLNNGCIVAAAYTVSSRRMTDHCTATATDWAVGVSAHRHSPPHKLRGVTDSVAASTLLLTTHRVLLRQCELRRRCSVATVRVVSMLRLLSSCSVLVPIGWYRPVPCSSIVLVSAAVV